MAKHCSFSLSVPDKSVDNYLHALEIVPECYETQKCVTKLPVNTFSSTIEYIPDQFKTQEICDKALDKCLFVFYSVPNQYKT